MKKCTRCPEKVPMAPTGNEDNCGVCRKAVRGEDNGLYCDSCECWFHAGCERVNKEFYQVLSKYKEHMWFCRKCRPDIKNAMHRNKQMEKQNAELKKEVEDLRKALQDLKAEIKMEVKNEIKAEIKQEMKRTFDEEKVVNRTVHEVFNHMHDYMREREDRMSRKNNLVMYKVPESDKQDPGEKQADDLAYCQDIIENSLGIDRRTYEIADISRMGRAGTAHGSRPLLIKMTRDHEKWGILRKAKELKHERDPVKRRIGISPDLTRQQREHDKTLRRELKERRDNGETGLYIKNGLLYKAGEVSGRM